MLKVYRLLIFIFVFFSVNSFGQIIESAPNAGIAKSAADAGNKTYIGRDEVKFLPGYSLNSASGNSMKAYTNKAMIIPTTYAVPSTDANFDQPLNLDKPVGFTPGSTGVSPSGGASYTVPIQLPPGTNGMVPAVAVSYNSQSGNGLLGMGWNLSAASAITRVPKTMYHDKVVEPVNFDWQDKFALDGNRLIFTGGAAGYGLDGSEYATEIETFSQIKSSQYIGGIPQNGPVSFTVRTKDGKTIYYGTSEDSRVYGKRIDKSNPSSPQEFVVAYQWLIKKVVDRFGNYYEYEYSTDGVDRRLVKIKYTGSATEQPYNTINFYYQERTDKNEVALNTIRYESKHLLRKIEIFAEKEHFKSYEFSYGEQQYSLLKEIKEIGANLEELNPIRFKYGETGLMTTENVPITPYVTSDLIPVKDFNNDGKNDLLKCIYRYEGNSIKVYYKWVALISDGNNGFTTYASGDIPIGYQNETFVTPLMFPITCITMGMYVGHQKNRLSAPTRVIDFNGDGKQDILLVKYNRLENGDFFLQSMKVILIKGLNIIEEISLFEWSAPNAPGKYVIPGRDVFTGDFDGNGTEDVMFINKNYKGETDYNIKVFSFNGTGAETKQVNIGPYSSLKYIPNAESVTTTDYNGDGKQELLTIFNKDAQPTEPTCHIFELLVDPSNGSLWESIAYKDGFPTRHHQFITGDFNGDGKTDILSRGNASLPWTVAFSDGYKFPVSVTNIPFFKSVDWDKDIVKPGDFNGDGKTDIFHGYNIGTTQTSEIEILYSFGVNATFSQSAGVNTFLPYKYSFNSELSDDRLVSGDFNGDGKTEELNPRSIYKANVFYFNKNSEDYQLCKITNEFNQTTSFAYSRPSKGSICYTSGSFSTFPIVESPFAVPVVKTISSPNGIGGFSSVSYSYAGAKVHTQGRGFLGFEKVTVKNLTTNISSVSNSTLNTQYGMLQLSQQSSFWGTATVPFSSVTYTNLIQTYPQPLRIWPYVKKSESIDDLNRFKSSEEYDYDSFGNALTVQSIKGSETTNITNTIDWFYSWIPASVTYQTISNTRNGQPAVSKSIKYSYNANGTLKDQTDFYGLPKSVFTTYSYTPHGNISSTEVSAAGIENVKSSFNYDSYGRFAIEKINPLLQSEQITYDAKWGKPLSVKSIEGLTTSFTYDGFGGLKSTKDPQNVVITNSTTWDIKSGSGDTKNAGNTICYTTLQHLGKPDVKEWFDGLGRSVQTEMEGLSNIIRTVKTYDYQGNLKTETKPFFTDGAETPVVTTYNYDYGDYNRLKSLSNGASTVSYAYPTTEDDRAKVAVTDINGTSYTIKDATGKIVEANDQGGTLKYSYFSSGKQEKVSLADGTVITSMKYDDYGNQTELFDKNAGTTTYTYDALGRLLSQKDAKLQNYDMVYDVMNRIKSKTGPSSLFTTYDYITSGPGLNQLKKTSRSGISLEYTYDDYGNLVKEKRLVDSEQLCTDFTYDKYNNLITTTYPSKLVTQNSYNSNGYLLSVIFDGKEIFKDPKVNAAGQYTEYVLGNGVKTTKTYDVYGLPSTIKAPGIQDLTYDFNAQTGNLNYRLDGIINRKELFTYDGLNRLLTSTVNDLMGGTSLPQIKSEYADNGNIKTKTDAGTYSYSNTQINAVVSVTNNPLNVSLLDQKIDYYDFDRTRYIEEGDDSTKNKIEFFYSPDDNRIKTISTKSSVIVKTKYFGSDYEKEIEGTTTRHIHYISGGDGLSAICVIENNGTPKIYYTYTDHLGSIVKVKSSTNEYEQNFDAWGRYRNPSDWSYTSIPASNPSWLTRGFTGHEHLKDFGLINMNNRMYDPIVARMLAVDNFVQNPFGTQSYNRYGYCFNNPLKYTDPDGEFPFLAIIIGAAIGFEFGGWQSTGYKELNPFKWSSNSLNAAIVGGLIGASVGAIAEMYVPWAAKTGAIQALKCTSGSPSVLWNVLSEGLLTADINMGVSWTQGHNLNRIAESGLIGLASGCIGGLVGSKFKYDNSSKLSSATPPGTNPHSMFENYTPASFRKSMPISAIRLKNLTTTTLNTFGRNYLDQKDGRKIGATEFIINSILGVAIAAPLGMSESISKLGPSNILGRYITSGLSTTVTNIDLLGNAYDPK